MDAVNVLGSPRDGDRDFLLGDGFLENGDVLLHPILTRLALQGQQVFQFCITGREKVHEGQIFEPGFPYPDSQPIG